MEEDIYLSAERLNIIVAYTDKNRFIANQNDLPWKRALKADMRFLSRFIRLEDGVGLIMGRKTYETTPAYKGILRVVLTRDKDYKADGAEVFQTFEDAAAYCRSNCKRTIIFGGAEVYAMALQYPCRLYCTVVEEGTLIGDRSFPESNLRLRNISKSVNDFLIGNEVTKTWEFKEDFFSENGFVFRFMVGEN